MAVDLYKGKIPICRRDLNEGFLRGLTDEEHRSTGCIPRDYSIDPVEMRDSPGQMKVYDTSEWDGLYDAGEQKRDTLEHKLVAALESGDFKFLDQNGFPDCWAHSSTHALMVDRLVQNLPFLMLNAVAIATLLRQTNGGWCGLSMKFIREHGAPVVGTGPGQWPYQSRRGSDTPELRAAMAMHKGLKDWYDLGKAEYDQTMSKQQMATVLFDNYPMPSDYNRASHSMLSVRLVRYEKNAWGWLTLNSWQQFGYHGLCVLPIDDGWVPDNACALRSSTPSAA